MYLLKWVNVPPFSLSLYDLNVVEKNHWDFIFLWRTQDYYGKHYTWFIINFRPTSISIWERNHDDADYWSGVPTEPGSLLALKGKCSWTKGWRMSGRGYDCFFFLIFFTNLINSICLYFSCLVLKESLNQLLTVITN